MKDTLKLTKPETTNHGLFSTDDNDPRPDGGVVAEMFPARGSRIAQQEASPPQTDTTPVVDPALVKVSTRLLPKHAERVDEILREHRRRFPGAAALRKEEVYRFAFDLLLREKDPVSAISKARN